MALFALFGIAAMLPIASARAQSCCAGATLVSPARLAIPETALAGLQLHMTANTGSFDAGGSYLAAPSSTSELVFGEDFIAAARVTSAIQLAILVPLVETFRKTAAEREFGGGVGDINLSARWDVRFAGESLSIPGIALLAGLTIPTGTPPDRAANALATDSTGIGAAQGTLGVALEQIYLDHVLVSASGLVSDRLPRSVRGIHSTLGVQLSVLLAAGWVFDSGAGVALAGRYETEGDAVIDGAPREGTGRRTTSLSLVGGLPLEGGWRLQGSLLDILPLSGLGRNQPAGVGLTLAVIRAL